MLEMLDRAVAPCLRYNSSKRRDQANEEIRQTKRSSGFTLIEIIVVFGLLSTVGFITSSIFFTTLKAGTKAELLKEVKQNGDYAISTMERMIRNARQISSRCDGSSQSIEIVNPDYQTTQFSCGNQIASNSAFYSAFLTTDKLVASHCSFTCQKPISGPKTVIIKFALSQKGSPTRPEEKASATFQTTVSLRTY